MDSTIDWAIKQRVLGCLMAACEIRPPFPDNLNRRIDKVKEKCCCGPVAVRR